ncbi:hypothetical protein AURDEDRAFT_123408 [Auricularia subglabra TFB-10046 SS5]|nr:hypothetical protein AURDEDRAFT_123408 [Auricularia subglabra TFB-10046 SS5]
MLASFISAARRRRETAEQTLALLEQRDLEVCNALDDAEAALRMAAATVAALTAEREDLRTKCAELNRTLEGLPSTFDPRILQRLPVELLRAVFEAATLEPDPMWSLLVPQEQEVDVSYNSGRARTPFCMAAVCRRWRATAIETPAIWCYVAVPTLRKASTSLLPHYKARIDTLLTRSKARPIDVLLEWDDHTAPWLDPDMGVYREIIASVGMHASRWSRVILTLPTGINLDTLEFLRSPTPQLEDLSLVAGDGDMAPWEDLPDFLPQCPRLKGLFITAIFLYPRSPWASLVNAGITVTDQPMEVIWHTLSMMPALQELEIVFQVPEDLTLPPPEPPTSQLCLPSLHSLSLQGYILAADSWTAKLELLQLESLTLPVGFCDTVVALLRADCAAATRLTLVDEVAAYDVHGFKLELLDMQSVEVLAAVRHLTIRKATLGPTFCDRLRGEHAASVWPKLESVTLCNVVCTPVSAERFVEFVKARLSVEGGAAFRVTMRGPSRPLWLKAQLEAILGERFIVEKGGDGMSGSDATAAAALAEAALAVGIASGT